MSWPPPEQCRRAKAFSRSSRRSWPPASRPQMAEECIGMNEDQQKRNYLDEHLPYMLKMLRYTYGQMLQKQHYLSWNAHFESFAVHARNLVNFLTNNDTGNFKAKDLVPAYRARISDNQGAMVLLREPVFHLAKRRPRRVSASSIQATPKTYASGLKVTL